MTKEDNEEALIAPEIFKTNQKYHSLRPSTRRHVDEGVQRQLWDIEHDHSLTAEGKERERKYYLEKGAELLLDNMWNLHQSLERESERRSGQHKSGTPMPSSRSFER